MPHILVNEVDFARVEHTVHGVSSNLAPALGYISKKDICGQMVRWNVGLDFESQKAVCMTQSSLISTSAYAVPDVQNRNEANQPLVGLTRSNRDPRLSPPPFLSGSGAVPSA
jgi:hypothetical protein